jgi:hypothetical protein
MSREQRFIGFLVLGFGILAVFAVLILAFGGRGGEDSPDAAMVETIQAEMAQPQDAETIAVPQIPPSRPYENTVEFPRQKEIDPAVVVGSWQAMVGRYTGVAQLDGRVFQIILASPDPAAPRTYASGTYRVFDDIIEFTPRTHWPAPSPPGGVALSYAQLTQASFSVVVTFRGGRMVWQNVPHSEPRVYTTLRSPLFMDEDINYVAWQKLAR